MWVLPLIYLIYYLLTPLFCLCFSVWVLLLVHGIYCLLTYDFPHQDVSAVSSLFAACWPALYLLTSLWVLLFICFICFIWHLSHSVFTHQEVSATFCLSCLLSSNLSLFCSVSAYQDVSAAHCASYSLSTNLSVCVSYQLVSCILCILFTACWSLSLYFCLLGCECPCLLELLPTDLYLTLLCLPACECYSVLSSSLPADLSPH